MIEPPVRRLAHAPRRFLADAEHAVEIDVQHAAPVALAHLQEIGAGRYAGIVDQDRDRSQRSLRRIESLGDRGAVGDVEGHGECLAPCRADLGFELLQAVEAAGGKGDLGTCVCQHARKVLPEARGGSRHQGCLAVREKSYCRSLPHLRLCDHAIRGCGGETDVRARLRTARSSPPDAAPAFTSCGRDNARA